MTRSIGVTVSAVVVLLGCLGMLFLGALTLAAPFLPKGPAAPPAPPFILMLISASMIFALAAWGILTAIGLFRLRPWARISMLIFSVFLVFTTMISTVAIFLVPMPAGKNVSSQIMIGVRVGIGSFYLGLMLIGVWWLYLFNKRTVKDQFRGAVGTAVAPARPLSITIIAWLMVVGAGGCLLAVPLRGPAVFLGLVLTGWQGSLTFLCFAAVELYLGLALLKLKPLSRVLSIYFYVFGIVNSLLMVALPGLEERLVAAMSFLPPEMRTQSLQFLSPSLLSFLVVMGAIVTAVPVWFLITRKAAFSADGSAI